MLHKLLLLILMLPLTGILSQANELPDERPDEPSDQPQQTRFTSGVLYYRDPETGELTTPPADMARLLQRDSANFSDQGLEMIIKPDGTKMVDLQGRFQMSSVIKTDADGHITHHCTTHPETLNATEHAALHQVVAEK